MGELYKPEESLESSSIYDLTSKISEYLDLHLMFPLLDFVDDSKMYDSAGVLQAKLDLLEPTKMIDYAVDIFETLHPNVVPKHLEDRKRKVFSELEELKEQTSPLLLVIENPKESHEINGNRYDWVALQDKFGFTNKILDAYEKLARFHFDCGDYTSAGVALENLLFFTGGVNATPKGPSLLWGRLACAILTGNIDDGIQIICEVKQMIEAKGSTALEQLQQRSWLLHWSLFVYFNHANGREELISLFFEEKYLQAIQTNSPWLLRYLVTAVILTRGYGGGGDKQSQVMKDLIHVIEQEQVSYSDPITNFLECLYVHFDFDGAMSWRRECEQVLKGDFFLCSVCDEFMEAARLFTFETYCRIHRKIDIALLASKMEMQPEEAEKWIADLIRTSKLDAKIDSRDNSVVMGASFPSVYQQVIEKTDDLSMRSYVLISNLKQYAQDHANGLTEDPSYGQQRGGYQRGQGKGGGGRYRD